MKPATIVGRVGGAADLSAVDGGYYADAIAALHARDYARALDLLQMARATKPKDARVLNAFGVVYDKLGRFDLSARYYAQAKAVDPTSVIVAHNMAYSAFLRQRAAVQAPTSPDPTLAVLAAAPAHARADPAAGLASGGGLAPPVAAPLVPRAVSEAHKRPRKGRSKIAFNSRTLPWRARGRSLARADDPRPERVSAIIEPSVTVKGGLT